MSLSVRRGRPSSSKASVTASGVGNEDCLTRTPVMRCGVGAENPADLDRMPPSLHPDSPQYEKLDKNGHLNYNIDSTNQRR